MAAICKCMMKTTSSTSPRLSEWVKGKIIGSGSFGSVHLAMNKSTGGLFVVKSASARSGAGREALDNEAKILKSLKPSPYIVQCLGTELEEDNRGNLNVFMEYMAGGSLADVAHKFGGSLHEDVVRVYTREILHGLKHLHQHGIVHCDLKCKNVLLGSSGNIKLADFGCAKNLNANSKLCCVGGTPLWMAPEVLRNETLGFAADVWSLGCTVIEMATGRPPCVESSNNSSNPMASVLRIAYGDGVIPLFPSHFSKEGLDFLTRCFQREPHKRCSAEDLLTHPFVSRNNKQYASSPTCVLEVQNFDESEAPHEATGLGSSGNWITVRSGG